MKTLHQTSLAILFTAITACCVFNLEPAFAGTRTWNGGATPDGNWTTPGNWNGIAPTTNDLIIFNGGTQTATTNNFAAGIPFNNLSFSSGASAFSLNGNPITISSPTDAGSGLIAGGSISSFSANNQTIHNPILFASGNHTITNGGAGFLNLNGTITHSNGAALVMFGKINAAGGLSTNGNLNGILGGWAVFGTNYATLDSSSNVIGFTNYTFVAPAGNIVSNPASNVKISSAGGAIIITNPVTAINSLIYAGTTANQVITMNSNKIVLGQNGGIFNISGLGGTVRSLNIGANDGTRGILTAGDGINPAQITFASAPLPSASGFITLQSAITDNGSAPVTVVLAGAYVSLNGAATGPTNTYSGGTYILQGRISQPNENTFGSGPIFIVSGGQANPGKATGTGVNITNDFYLEGSGTVENQGMGALRLFGSGGVTIGAVTTGTKLTGKITLTGNASVCANGDTTGGIGISGKITGPGGFILGSPTFAANNNNGAGGAFTIGDVGGLAIPNDYAGDTTINGSASSSTQTSSGVGATLRIFTAADNNIMPHGSTGSFAGGKTGNLILKATAAGAIVHGVTFDLNGSTQTINGLSTAGTSLANNFVASSNAPGVLILGDSDATATFAGVVQDGAGLSLTKIGIGSENLTGPNTYTGDTIVKAGKLGTTTASIGGGNYSVSNNAALGVTTVSAGGTLSVNSLTLAPSASLQLNVSTNGNPSGAMVTVHGALNISGTVAVSIGGATLSPGGPFTVMTYNPANRAGGGSFIMVNSPRVVATLNDDTVNGILSVTVTSVDTAIKWNGTSAGIWDINDTNNTIWQTIPSAASAFYIESGTGNDAVQFDDSLTGTTNVNITTNVAPQSITVNNSAKDYVFTGSGRITGDTGLTKQGTGNLIIANTGNNDFAGDIALSAGTLVVSNDSSFPNTISGPGALLKVGGSTTLALSGNNVNYTGPVVVSAGTLKVLNGVALQTAASTTISNGAVLDIGLNSVDMGTNAITVSGSGQGAGAIINSSGNGNFLVSNFKNLTLAGNTVIGGPGRLDLRSTDANLGTDSSLSTGGNAYSLTKVSGNQFQIAGAQVDSALGDIDIQGGTLGIQGEISSLGNPNNLLTIESGATFQLFAVANVITKPVLVKDGGTINSANNINTYGGTVTLEGTSLFNIANSSLTLNNVVGGTGTLAKVVGTFPLILSGANTYSGGTVANAGLVSISADNNLGALPGSPTPANIILNGGGVTSSTDVTISPNRGIALGPVSGAGTGTLDTSSTLTYNGTIANNGAGVGSLIISAGSVFLGGTNTYTGTTTVQASLDLTGNGSISSSSQINMVGSIDVTARVDGTLTLAPGQTMTGSGNIVGNLTNGPGSTIAPSAAGVDGFFTVFGNVVLKGTNIMNLDKDNGNQDSIGATGKITYGGTLVLVISNTFAPLVDGDAFPIYNAASFGGAFANIIPASPGSGLAWNTNTLTTDGILRVTTGPTFPTTNASIATVTLSGTNLLVHGTNNNVPNTSFHYAVLTSTNVSLPLSSWTPIVTNAFNADGTFDYTNPIVTTTPRQFIDVLAVP